MSLYFRMPASQGVKSQQRHAWAGVPGQTDRHTEAYHIHQVLVVPTGLLWLLLSAVEKKTSF